MLLQTLSGVYVGHLAYFLSNIPYCDLVVGITGWRDRVMVCGIRDGDGGMGCGIRVWL